MPSSSSLLLSASGAAPFGRPRRDDEDESSCEDVLLVPSKQKEDTTNTAEDKNSIHRRLWQQRLQQGNVDDVTKELLSSQSHSHDYSKSELDDMYTQLQQVVVLDGSSSACQDFLKKFNGKLVSLPHATTEWLQRQAPTEWGARVADFNENLYYAMQPQRGLSHLVMTEEEAQLCQALEDTLQRTLQTTTTLDYQGSFMTTESTNPQPAHVDFAWEILQQHHDDLTLGFFPLRHEGCFLQVWPRNDTAKIVPGTVVYIPYGQCLLLPSHTIHGGGFKSSNEGNLRFHLYIASHGSRLPQFQTNKYVEEFDKGRELAERYVNAPNMKLLEEVVFV
jgi:hypothetical protein